MDVWTACTQQCFLEVTVHGIDTEWTIKTLLLDFIPLHESHTGEYLEEMIFKLVEKLEITNKIIGFTGDNATNNQTCLRYLQKSINPNLIYVHCAAHVLNLVVKKGQKKYISQIKKARQFCSKIRNSPLFLEDLKRIFAILNRPFLQPILDIETRWNSTYLMLERLVEIQNVTDGLVQSHPELKEIYLESSDWEIIKDTIQLLKPFYKASCTS